MTYDNTDDNDDGIVDADVDGTVTGPVNNGSVNTENATIANAPADENGVVWPILRESGYTEGDVYPLFSTEMVGNTSTTSTSYQSQSNADQRINVARELLHDTDRTLMVSIGAAMFNDNAGETCFVELTDNGTAISGTETSISGTDRTVSFSSWTEYDPGANWEAISQIKVSGGTGNFWNITMLGGIQL